MPPHGGLRRRLAENDLKQWRKDMWCIPQVDGSYVARMEDVLNLYAEADPISLFLLPPTGCCVTLAMAWGSLPRCRPAGALDDARNSFGGARCSS